MKHNSRSVLSNQVGINEKLIPLLEKYQHSVYQKTPLKSSIEAFEQFMHTYRKCGSNGLVLDSCCGVGESSYYFSQKYGNKLVVGIDKSLHRLEKKYPWKQQLPQNLLLLQSDIYDFWHLLRENKIAAEKHFVLFPNPWPKKQHLKRRIHTHPVFADFLAISQSIEIRTNWHIYLDEMAVAAQIVGKHKPKVETYTPEHFITPFERKYAKSGQQLYKMDIHRNDLTHN